MSLWLAPDSLVLASRSTARRALLEAAGIPIESHPAEIDERGLEQRVAAQAPAAVAAFLAREKAAVVAALHPTRLVLGADQMLGLETERFSKPADLTAARAQLFALRGRTHELHSAIAFVQDTTVMFERVDTVSLTMRSFSESFLDRYLDTAGIAAPASVGGYQIEGPGIQLFERIDGDYFTILGLPLMAALDFLRRYGYLAA
jgi:septum formation protein